MNLATSIAVPTEARMIAELLAFPAQHLQGLPVVARFAVEGSGISQEILWSTGKPSGAQEGVLCFGGDELRAIAIGVQAERLWPADFKAFCFRKRYDPNFRVTERIALDGAQPDEGSPWLLGQVLARLELGIVSVAIDVPELQVPLRVVGAAA